VDIEEIIKSLLDPRLTLTRLQGQQVILEVGEKMTSGSRGKLLLDTEKQLRKAIGQPLEVLLEPRGDLNKLRKQLRGVALDGPRDEIFAERYENSDPQGDGGDLNNG
jgi:hypothetical protein